MKPQGHRFRCVKFSAMQQGNVQPSIVSGRIGSNALVSLGASILELWLGSGANFWSQSCTMAILHYVADLAQRTN